MIQLHPDYLLVQKESGQTLPCAAEDIAVELVGEAANCLDKEMVHNAALAVLYYFKNEVGKNYVTVGEFSQELEKVLSGFGLQLKSAEATCEKPAAASHSSAPEVSCDLCHLARESAPGFEMIFFQRLRDEMRTVLRKEPAVLRFEGLRACVKLLVGSRRWSHRCQQLSDQIVDFLRQCLTAEAQAAPCALVVC